MERSEQGLFRWEPVRETPDRSILGYRYEAPLRDGWYLTAEFRFHHGFDDTADEDGTELVLTEIKVFPGGERQRYLERQAYFAANPRQRRRVAGGRPDQYLVEPEIGAWDPDSDDLWFEVDPAGLTTRLLRSVRVGDLIAEARAGLAETAEEAYGGGLASLLLEVPVHRPGRAGRGDEFYARWAAAYAAKVSEGSRSPVADLAAERGVKRATVRDLVYKARDRKLLTKQDAKGRAGGQLTDRARELLAQMTEEE